MGDKAHQGGSFDDIIAEDDRVIVDMTLRAICKTSALPMHAEIKPESQPVKYQFIHISRILAKQIAAYYAQRNDLGGGG